MSSYPEHDKLSEVKERSQACGEFLDWLREQGYWLCRLDDHDCFYQAHVPTQNLLAEYFQINQAALETEKRAMLYDLQQMQKA